MPKKGKQFSTYLTHLTLHFGGKSRGSWYFCFAFFFWCCFYFFLAFSYRDYIMPWSAAFRGLMLTRPKKEWNRIYCQRMRYLMKSVNRVFAGLSKIGMIAYQYEMMSIPNRTPYNHLFNSASHFYLTIVSCVIELNRMTVEKCKINEMEWDENIIRADWQTLKSIDHR